MIDHINRLLEQDKNDKAAQLIRICISEGIDLKNNNIRYAGVLALDNDWEAISRLLPPEMNVLETSGWLQSLKAGRPIDRNGLPLPWLPYAAIDFIGAKINSQMRVFEWGAGYSTLWFATKVAEVVSTEDNLQWYNELQLQLPVNVKLSCANTQQEYVNAISMDTGFFDIIVIDGSHRNDCCKVSIDKLSDNGFIVFDNSDSADFDESMNYFNQQGFFRIDFWGLIPSYLYKNCTSIFLRNPSALKNEIPPSKQLVSTGISCFQSYDNQSRC